MKGMKLDNEFNLNKDMTFNEFKEKIKLTHKEQIEYDIEKSKNLFRKKLYKHITINCFGILAIMLCLFNTLSFTTVLITYSTLSVVGLYSLIKLHYYSIMVHINNMTDEDHYEIFKNL